MAQDISIAITAMDNFTNAIKTMQNANEMFQNDLSGLLEKLNALNKTKIDLKVDFTKAKRALQDAEKHFLRTGQGINQVEKAFAKFDNARRNLDLVSAGARQVERDIINLTNALSKAENRASTSRGLGNLLTTLKDSGAFTTIGNILGDVTKTYVSSAYGKEAGNIVGNVISSIGVGAAIGTAIAPGIGTLIGGIAGSIAGYAQGTAQNFESEDEAFKSYYRKQYETLTQAQANALSSGIEIASQREQDLLSFTALLGNRGNALRLIYDMADFALRTPYNYEDLAAISRTLLSRGFKQHELIPLLETVGDAGTVLGMSNEDMRHVATTLGLMKTTGITTMEQLNSLQERNIDAWRYLAEALGKAKEEVQEMVRNGLVPGEEAARAIADCMAQDFTGGMAQQASTYASLVSTLQERTNELNKVMGEGYIEERKRGIQEEIEYLNSNDGLLQDAYKKMGMYQASLENLADKYQRDAVTAVMTGEISGIFSGEAKQRLMELYEEYKSLQAQPMKYTEDGEAVEAVMGRLLTEAKAIGQNEYNASDEAQAFLKTQKQLIENIRNDADLKESYWNVGYVMGIEFSKGRAAGAKTGVSAMTIFDNLDPIWINYTMPIVATPVSSFAYGIRYVPYDGFPIIAHQGERLLTAAENRSLSIGSSVNITGNTFVVREEADIPKIAREIAAEFERACLLS